MAFGAGLGAPTLVKEDVALWELVAGIPARRIGERSRELLNAERRLP